MIDIRTVVLDATEIAEWIVTEPQCLQAVAGDIWITTDRTLADHWIKPGQYCDLPLEAKVVVSGWNASVQFRLVRTTSTVAFAPLSPARRTAASIVTAWPMRVLRFARHVLGVSHSYPNLSGPVRAVGLNDSVHPAHATFEVDHERVS